MDRRSGTVVTFPVGRGADFFYHRRSRENLASLLAAIRPTQFQCHPHGVKRDKREQWFRAWSGYKGHTRKLDVCQIVLAPATLKVVKLREHNRYMKAGN